MSALRTRLRRHVPAAVRMRLRPPPPWTVQCISSDDPRSLTGTGRRVVPVLDRAALDRHALTFAADPFAVHVDGRWHVFVEVLPRGRRTAEIGLVTSDDLESWQYEGTVLREPFHLSYPYVFAADGSYWMVPETFSADAVRLYRATDFPRQWRYETTLLAGEPFKDASLFQYDGAWQLLVETSDHQHDELRLYRAPALLGPWHEHPASPVVVDDARIARPGGRPVVHDGRLLRFAQDCADGYGRAVHALEIEQLTATTYRERLLTGPVIAANGEGWHARGAHHVDAHETPDGWVCFADGYA